MKKLFNFAPIILGVLLLVGCDNTKSVDWYKSHIDEMNAKYKTCISSDNDSLDCKNARAARFELRQENAKVPDLN